jgi:hypothetical protein
MGELAFEQISFQSMDAADLQITIHVPLRDGATTHKIEELLKGEYSS